MKLHRLGRALAAPICLLPLVLLAASAQPLAWPAVTNETKPWSRWWWLGSISTEAGFRSEMEKYAAAGLGGLEITPIYGVRGYEDQFITYLTPEWMSRFEFVLKEGRRLDLGIDMATGNGWPFGGPWVQDDTSSRYLAYKVFTVPAGARLAEKVEYIERPMITFQGGPTRVTVDQVKHPISSNDNLQELAINQIKFPHPAPLHTLMAFAETGGGAPLDLTKNVGADGTLDWTAPADRGAWKLYAVFTGLHGKQVERAGPGGEGNVIDHFEAASLQAYLKRFDEAFAGRDISWLRGFYNDSYEVDDANGESNFTPRFFEQFQQRRGYDLRTQLPALIAGFEAPPAGGGRGGRGGQGRGGQGQGAGATTGTTPPPPPAPVVTLTEEQSRVLSDFRETISDLLLDEFTKPWAAWAEKHGALVRNQAHGSPANIIDLYAASGIPEQESEGATRLKMASSAAHVTGRKLSASETATWLTEHFITTLADIKARVDETLLGGINHICYHGTAYSPPDDPWPGFHFYASVEANPSNSWWDHFGALNQYVTRAQSFLQSGQPAESVLLYYPIHDLWAAGGGRNPHFANMQGSGGQAAQAMWGAGVTFDYVTDRMLAETTFANNALTTSGGTSYEAIVVPETKLMPLETMDRLFDLAQRGATVVFHRAVPADVPGWGNLNARRSQYQVYAEAFRRSSQRGPEGITALPWGKGRLVVGEDLLKTIDWVGVKAEPFPAIGLNFVRRRHEHGMTYFLVNQGTTPVVRTVTLDTGATSAAMFDPMTGEYGIAPYSLPATPGLRVDLALAPGESRILQTFHHRELSGPEFRHWNVSAAAQPLAGTWRVEFVQGGPTLPPAASLATNELKSWTEFAGDAGRNFSGTARYTVTFAKPADTAEAGLLDLGRVAESARVKLNGRDLGVVFTAPYHVRVPADWWREQNTLEVEVANLMANRIADLDRRGVPWKKFYNTNMPARVGSNRGPDGYFTAANWEPRESGLIGPVTLAPLAAPRR